MSQDSTNIQWQNTNICWKSSMLGRSYYKCTCTWWAKKRDCFWEL